jgi:trans-aconitate methyltransferase
MDLAEARARAFEATVRHPWETARIEVVGDLIRRRVALAPGAIVMDIGCGDTFVVERLAAEYGAARFYAIDTAFTGELIEHYRARLNNPRILTFPSLDAIAPLPDRPASLVLLMDVIEHIEDDEGFLKALRARPYVGPGTKLLITVPAYQSLFCSHDAFLGHYRRYSNRTLREHVERSGFSVLDIGYFFTSLLPLRLLQVVKERALGLKPERNTSGLVTWTGGAGAAALLHAVLVSDARFSRLLGKAGIRLPGLSNYAICVKSA